LNLTTEDKLVLYASKLHISENEIRQVEEAIPLVKDWNYFTENAIQNGSGPLLFKNLPLVSNSNLIPKEYFEKFGKAYYRSLSRNMVLYEHLKNIVNIFSKEGIEVIALKGILMAESIYGDIALRQMSDIDLLLKEHEAEKAWNILKAHGYQYQEFHKTEFITNLNDHKHMPQLIMNGIQVELHYRTHIRYRGFDIKMEDYWAKSQPVVLNGVSLRKLCPEHQIQHSFIHLDEHFSDGKPQIYGFIDIAGVIEKYSSEIDWNYFDESSRDYKCDNIVYKYLFLLNKYFNIDLPQFIINKAKTIIDSKTERLFIHYLQHYRKDLPLELSSRNYEILSHINGFRNKIKYLIDDLFPSKKFMLARYKIKNKNLLFWFYIKRIWVGIKSIYLIILSKIVTSIKSGKS